ncbi:3',5'-cyclic-nucleotide phosphodiesterase pde1 [Rhodotorula kratochvilovae]
MTAQHPSLVERLEVVKRTSRGDSTARFRSRQGRLGASRASASTAPAPSSLSLEQHCGHLRLCKAGDRPAFELLVLGCGGGPIETNLSSFLIKPFARNWTDGCTGIEGGSTIGAVASLVERNPYAFEGFGLQIGVDAHELDLAPVTPSGRAEHVWHAGEIGVGREGGGKAAARVWDLIRCFAITHAHLDHIAGLIISSAACRPPPKPVYGVTRTIANVERLMDGGVWPMLGGWDDSVTIGKAYHYKHIPIPTPAPLPLSPALSFHAFPLSHGLDPSAFHKHKKGAKPRAPSDGDGTVCIAECYDSTAFFVREEESGREMLFFGDVEPDSISLREFNLDIWKAAAPKIVAGQLSVIFLECSYPSSQPKDKLFGHFSPPFILEEMVVLADQLRRARLDAGWSAEAAAETPLRDVIVVIQHIKDDIFTFPTPVSDAPPPLPPKPLPAVPRSTPLPPPPPGRAPPPAKSAHSPPLLSMGPPAPSLPTRRPSSTAFGFGAPLAGASAASSRQSKVFSGDFSAFTLGPGGAGARRASAQGLWAPHAPTSPGRLVPPRELARDEVSPRSRTVRGADREKSAREYEDEVARLATRASTYSIAEESAGGSAPATPVLGGAEEEEDEEEDEEEMVDETVHERIERELNELEAREKTGVRFLIALQGMRLVF